VGDRVYAASCAGAVFAFDRQSGEVVWSHVTGSTFHGEPVVTGGLLIVPSDDGSVIALALDSGEVAWRTDLPPEGVLPDLLLGGSRVLGLTALGEPFALDVASGGLLWIESSDGGGRHSFESPALSGGLLFHAGSGGEISARETATGLEVWRRELDSPASAGLLVAANGLIVATADQRLYRLDLDSGETLSTYELPGRPHGALQAAGERVVVVTEPNLILAVSADLYSLIWSLPTAEEWSSVRPLIEEEIVVAGNREGELVGAGLADGAMLWSVTLGGFLRGIGKAGDTYYVGNLDGTLFAWRPGETSTCAEVEGLGDLVTTGRILLIGEIHGTAESPAFALAAACHAHEAGLSATVGLELPPSELETIGRFLDSDGGPEARAALLTGEPWQREYQDGRTSAGMVALLDGLRRLRAAGGEIEVALFDHPGFQSQERDRLMAATLLGVAQARSTDRLIVLTGNIHSRLTPGTRWDAEYRPMGHLLAGMLGPKASILALDVARTGGSAWICTGAQPEECGERPLDGRAPVSAPAVELGAELGRGGHHGVYSMGTLTASPPAVGER
jgi:outer membrane protein assembly factor BamB